MHMSDRQTAVSEFMTTKYRKSSNDWEPLLKAQVIACNEISKPGLKLIMLCSTLEGKGA